MRAVVQHHGSRVSILPRLLERLDGFEVEVVEDSGERLDPWRGYRRALAALGNDAGVILQDDSLPVSEFNGRLTVAVRDHPDAVLCLYLSAVPARTAKKARQAMLDGEPTVPIDRNEFVPVVANWYPAGIANCVLTWAEDLMPTRHRRSDDHMMGMWYHDCKYDVLALVPSLVEHPDDVPSVIAPRRGGSHVDPRRRALHLA